MGTTADNLFGGATLYLFDGSNDSIAVPALLSNVTKFGIGCWVRFSGAQQCIFSHGQAGVFTNDILIGRSGSTGIVQVNSSADGSATFTWPDPTISLSPSHIVVNYDGTQATNATRLRVWINSREVTLTFAYTVPSTTSTIGSPLARIGEYGSAAAGWWLLGRMDDFRLSLQNFTDSEIFAWFCSGRNYDSVSAFASGGGMLLPRAQNGGYSA
jgi:hypothetical protein